MFCEYQSRNQNASSMSSSILPHTRNGSNRPLQRSWTPLCTLLLAGGHLSQQVGPLDLLRQRGERYTDVIRRLAKATS